VRADPGSTGALRVSADPVLTKKFEERAPAAADQGDQTAKVEANPELVDDGRCFGDQVPAGDHAEHEMSMSTGRACAQSRDFA
jgi:hypothetical protein